MLAQFKRRCTYPCIPRGRNPRCEDRGRAVHFLEIILLTLPGCCDSILIGAKHVGSVTLGLAPSLSRWRPRGRGLFISGARFSPVRSPAHVLSSSSSRPSARVPPVLSASLKRPRPGGQDVAPPRLGGVALCGRRIVFEADLDECKIASRAMTCAWAP